MSNEQQFSRCAYLSPGLSMLWVMYEKPFFMSKWLDFGRSIFFNMCLAHTHTHITCHTTLIVPLHVFVFFIGWSGKELFGIFIFTNKTRKTRVSRFKLSKCDWRQGREKCCVLKNEENQIVFCVSALCTSIQVVPSFATPIDGALSAFTVVGLVWTPYCIVKPAKPIQFFKNLILFGKFGPPNDSTLILTHPVPGI